MYDVIIVGAGPAGLTTAIYTARGGLSTLVLESTFSGGQMAISHTIENYPGFDKEIPGSMLAHNMEVQAKEMGAEIKPEAVTKFDLEGDVKKIITSKNTYEGRAVVLAMGATPRKLDIEGEEKFIGSGVSYCATCDGAFFKDRDVAVIGGGNTALEDALYLAKFCTKVYLIHRRDQFRGQHALSVKCQETPNIEFVMDSVPTQIKGEFMVDTLCTRNLKTDAERDLAVSGVFVAVGQQPETHLVNGLVNLTPAGYIDAGEDCKTNIPGVFCAGDIRNKTVRQIVTAAADGAVAAAGIELYFI